MVTNEEMIHTNRDLGQWIRDAGRGDRDALHRLYRAAAPSVYAYALSILQNHHDAEDVLQDCFLTVRSGGGNYRPQDTPMGWLMTVTRNLCLKQLRSRSRTQPLESGDWLSAVSPDPEDRLIIESCLKLLSDEERQIVILHAVAGFKHREIAAHLGLKTATVLTKYRRAIQKLKESL